MIRNKTFFSKLKPFNYLLLILIERKWHYKKGINYCIKPLLKIFKILNLMNVLLSKSKTNKKLGIAYPPWAMVPTARHQTHDEEHSIPPLRWSWHHQTLGPLRSSWGTLRHCRKVFSFSRDWWKRNCSLPHHRGHSSPPQSLQERHWKERFRKRWTSRPSLRWRFHPQISCQAKRGIQWRPALKPIWNGKSEFT